MKIISSIVENNKLNQAYVSRILEKQGLRVIEKIASVISKFVNMLWGGEKCDSVI